MVRFSLSQSTDDLGCRQSEEHNELISNHLQILRVIIYYFVL